MNCQNCGCVVVGRIGKKYCSHNCAKAHHYKKKAKVKEESKPILVCPWCKTEFKPIKYHPDKTQFCSVECRSKLLMKEKSEKLKSIRDANPIPPRNCAFCKTTFTPSNYGNKDQKFCSRDCHQNEIKQQLRIKSAQIRANTIRTCPICDSQFNPKKTLKEIYCSSYCRQVIGKRIYKMMQRCYENTNTSKADHSHDVLGYSPNDLLKHLQMFSTWDSLKQDSWHLDHIFPIIAFVRKGIADPKIICCLRNLQPLAGQENCVKNDSYDQKEFDAWLETIQIEVAV